jgi:hypothetical protein
VNHEKPETPCDEWPRARDRRGYGKATNPAGPGMVFAHRKAWAEAFGPIPDGMVVMHLCDNPPCVRLDHLAIGSQAENLQMMRDRGRGYRARECPRGHEYTPENTYRYPSEGYAARCKQCRNAARASARQRKLKEAAA